MRNTGCCVVSFALAGVLSGCESKHTAPTTAPSVAASNVIAAAPANVAQAPRVAPNDLSVEPILKDLKCDKKAKTDSCRILSDFAAGTRWLAQMPAGEGRWIGYSFVREKGAEKRQLILLWAKQMPTSQVAVGDLPLRVGTGSLSEDSLDHGFKMAHALSVGDQPSRHNQARQQVESFVPTTHRGAVNTAGASVRLIAEEPTYLRQSGRKVLIVMPNQAANASPGDGTYAELWRATW